MKDFLEQTKADLDSTLSLFNERQLDPHGFCLMPFINLTLEPTGEVGLCRHKGSEFTFGNLREKSIDEIWQDQRLQDWRKELLTGKKKTCQKELIEQQCNLCPELNKLLPYATLDTASPKILRLTANLNGFCNLECPMCDVWLLPNGFYTEENFWIPARERFFKEIMEVDMLSGEPFIQKDTFRLIKEIADVNRDCRWSFTTNLQWQWGKTIEEHLDRIRIKHIIVSIDSLKEDTYAVIRKGGHLKKALETLKHLKAYQLRRRESGDGFDIRLNCTTQRLNWHEVSALISFCKDNKIIPFLSFLYEPSQYSLLSLENKEKMRILENYFATLTKEEMRFSSRIIRPLIRSLPKLDYTYFLLEFKKMVNDEI